jgi:dTDP-4-dehydrorhamnose 3,5-epimerase
MKVGPTGIPDVLVVESPVFHDERGFLTEMFHQGKFGALGVPTTFVQDNHSHSKRHVLRGLHYQVDRPQGKLVSVIRGVIFDVAVDLRRSSPTFGKWVGEVLESGTGRQLWIPEGLAHGFLVLSDSADVVYKCTAPYSQSGGRTLLWNDPSVGVAWPLPHDASPVVNERDASAPTLAYAEVFP